MESHVESITMPSKKLPSAVISTWSAIELREGISTYFGSFSTMPSQMPVVITSTGKPPASRTPCFTRSASAFKCTWPGLYSFQLLTMPMSGRACSSGLMPMPHSRPRRHSRASPNSHLLRRFMFISSLHLATLPPSVSALADA